MTNCKRIDFKKSAEKFLKSRPRKEQIRILTKIHKLPGGEHIRKMEGYENRYRLRVGDFRVIYDIYSEKNVESDSDITILVILVVEIGNRGDVYKNVQ